MEITLDLIRSLKDQDVARILDYMKLLTEATEAVEVVSKAYKFNMRQEKVTVYRDASNAEYLTHEGVWQARYLHQQYDVCVTVEGVFEVYKAKYERDLERHDTIKVTDKNTAESADYFRSFVNRCRLKVNANK